MGSDMSRSVNTRVPRVLMRGRCTRLGWYFVGAMLLCVTFWHSMGDSSRTRRALAGKIQPPKEKPGPLSFTKEDENGQVVYDCPNNTKLYERDFQTVRKAKQGKQSYRIMQFNLLADSMCAKEKWYSGYPVGWETVDGERYNRHEENEEGDQRGNFKAFSKAYCMEEDGKEYPCELLETITKGEDAGKHRIVLTTTEERTYLGQGLVVGPFGTPQKTLLEIPHKKGNTKVVEDKNIRRARKNEEGYNVLRWENRRHRLMEEIKRWKPDIVTVQELDSAHKDWFAEAMWGLSASVYKGCGGDWRHDGVGVYWNPHKFDKIGEAYEVLLRNYDGQPAAFVHLREISGGAEFVLASAHFKAGVGENNEKKRMAQMEHVEEILKTKFPFLPVVFGTDLNAEPTQMTDEGVAPTELYKKVTEKMGLHSSYSEAGSCHGWKTEVDKVGEPVQTTYKIRVNGDQPEKTGKLVHRTSDFLFFTRKLFHVLRLLDIPEDKELEQYLLPGYRYPSDHFSIATEVEFPSKKDVSDFRWMSKQKAMIEARTEEEPKIEE